MATCLFLLFAFLDIRQACRVIASNTRTEGRASKNVEVIYLVTNFRILCHGFKTYQKKTTNIYGFALMLAV